MLKLNLLPASYRQRGSVKAAALTMLVIWLVILLGLAIWAVKLKSAIAADASKTAEPLAKIEQIKQLDSLAQSYKGQADVMAPETQFVTDVDKEPLDIISIMDTIARSDRPHVIFHNYSIAEKNPAVSLYALAANYRVFTEWRLALVQNPDFVGVPQISGPTKGPAIAFPRSAFPQGIPMKVDVQLTKTYTVPLFSPTVASGDSTLVGGAAGAPAGMGGYPGMPGGGAPGMGGGGYPGMPGGAGAAPAGAPAVGKGGGATP